MDSSLGHTALEQLVYHDVDNGALGFVNYVTPSGAQPSLVGSPQFYSVNAALEHLRRAVALNPENRSIARQDPRDLVGGRLSCAAAGVHRCGTLGISAGRSCSVAPSSVALLGKRQGIPPL